MSALALAAPSDASRDFRNKLLFVTAASSTALVAGVAPSHAAIDVTTVSAQADAAVTAITTVGVTLLAMAFGLLVFSVSTNVIRRVMGG